MNRNLAVGLALGVAAGRRSGGDTHNHTHIEMVDPSVEKGARFLDEVQEKAAARITNAILVDVPSINARLVTYDLSRSFESDSLEHRLVFTVNDKPFTLNMRTQENEDLLKALVDKITNELLRQIAPSTLKMLTRKAY